MTKLRSAALLPLLSLLPPLLSPAASGAATYVVNHWEDEVDVNPGDGICDVDSDPVVRCSLRAAVQESERFDDPDRIEIPPPPPGESISMDLHSSLEGGRLLLLRDTVLVGLGPEPVEIVGGGESNEPVFDFWGSDQVPVIENVVIRCREPTFFFRGLLGSGRGVLRDSVITGCGRGYSGEAWGDVAFERVVIESNYRGISLAGGNLLVTDSVVRANEATGSEGGGVYVYNSDGGPGILTLERSLLTDNAADQGGGMFLDFLARAVLVDSTVSGNRAVDHGGGIYAELGAELEIAHSTIASNEADSDGNGSGDGGGLWADGDTLISLRSSVLSDNSAAGPFVTAWDCFAVAPALTSRGHNLIHRSGACNGVTGDPTNVLEQSANLGVLRNNGGPTLSHLPNDGSPVVDGGDPATCGVDHDLDPGTPPVALLVDQRGFGRAFDGDGDTSPVCDIGSVEKGAALPIFDDGFESGDQGAWSS